MLLTLHFYRNSTDLRPIALKYVKATSIGFSTNYIWIKLHFERQRLCCLWSASKTALQNNTFGERKQKTFGIPYSAHSYQRNACCKFHPKH